VTKSALKFLASVLIVVGILGGLARAFLVTPVHISDDGMAPTLLAGETVLMWNTTETPEFGDVLVCRHPRAGGYVVGRFIARPGMVISADRGSLRVDNVAPDRNQERTLAFTMHGATRPTNVMLGTEHMGGIEHPFIQDATVGYRARDIRVTGGIFLMGDNRLPHEFDSRTYGPVDPATCVGHVFLRWKTAEHRVEFDNAVLDVID
jgi:signal peptidase I